MQKKKIIIILWIILIVACFICYVFLPKDVDIEFLRKVFSDNLYVAALIFLILSTVRGFTLFPVSGLLIPGVLLFPPVPLFVLTLLGVVSSSTLVYYFSQYLGFDLYFEEKYPKKMANLKRTIVNKEMYAIALWSLIPIAPGDLICYIASVLHVKLWKCLVGMLVGSSVLYAVYIFGGSWIMW